MSNIGTIIDIGSSKVVCLVFNGTKSGAEIRGVGVCEYSGYRFKRFTDVGDLEHAVAIAINAAEQESHLSIRSMTVSVPGEFINAKAVRSSYEIKGGKISDADANEFIRRTQEVKGGGDFKTLIYSEPYEFFADGEKHIDVPVGVAARRLEANIANIFVSEYFEKIVVDVLGKMDIKVDGFISSTLAEALFLMDEHVRANGGVIVDIGHKNTEIGYIIDNALIESTVIEVGGMHFASDLAVGLNIPIETAENLKRRNVYSLDCRDSVELMVDKNGENIEVEQAAIQYIIEERTEELLRLIRHTISDMGIPLRIPIYFTGGGLLRMQGSHDVLRRAFKDRAVVSMPRMPRLNAPNYASVLSVMDFMLFEEDDARGSYGEYKDEGLLDKLKKLIGR